MVELTSLFLDEIKNIKVEHLRKDDKKMILYNDNRFKKHQLLKNRHENKINNVKNTKETITTKDNDNNDNDSNQKSVNIKQKTNKYHQTAQQIEKSLISIEEWRDNFLKLCGLIVKLKKKKVIEKEMAKDVNRYNSLYKHIWNIYCVNDIFFRIVNKFLIFQSDDSGSELMNIVSSMNESSKKLNISSIITQLCSNFINMLIDIRNINLYSNEYLYLITMMLTNVEKSLKKYYRKPTYWIKLIDDIIKILFPSHFLEIFNQPIENQSNDNLLNKESHEEPNIHKTLSSDEITENKKRNISNNSINHLNDNNTITPSTSPINKDNIPNTKSIIPSIFLSNSDNNINSDKLSLPSITTSSSAAFLPPISSTSSTLPAIPSTTSKMPNIEKKMKRCDSLEPLEPISKTSSLLQPISNTKSLSRSSSTSSLDNGEEFYQVLTKHTIKNDNYDTLGIKNEIKLFFIKSIIRNIEETIRDCDYIPLNLCSIPLPSLKNHKRSVSVIQKKNSLINLPSVKTPLPPTTKKPKNQSIQKKRSSISNSKSITTDSNQKSVMEKQEKLEYQDNRNNELEIMMDDTTTDSEIYDDFDSESSLDSRNKDSSSEDERENDIQFNKKINIYEQETIYFIQFKLKEYIESLKQYTVELSNIRVNYKNYLVLTLQNLIEKHMLLLQSYYKKFATSTKVDSSKPYYSRQRQQTAIEPSLNSRSYSKVESIKNPILLQKSSSITRNSLRDPLLIQNRLKIYSTLPSAKTPLHVNVTNIVLEPIKRSRTKIPSIKHDTKIKPVNPLNSLS